MFRPYLKAKKNFGGKQNFPPKSCFPILETKSLKPMPSLEKACLNYQKKSNSNKYINWLTKIISTASKNKPQHQKTYCFSAENFFHSIIFVIQASALFSDRKNVKAFQSETIGTDSELKTVRSLHPL